MALFIVILIIALVALTLYDHLSPSLPQNWRLSKDSSGTAAAVAQAPVYGMRLPSASSDRWTLSSDGHNTRAVRQFETPVQSSTHQYDPPLMYFSCYQHHLYAWLDTRLQAQPSPHNASQVELQLNGTPVFWSRGQGQTLAVPDPNQLLDLIERNRALTITLAFQEAPRQSLRLPLGGSQQLFDAVATCAK